MQRDRGVFVGVVFEDVHQIADGAQVRWHEFRGGLQRLSRGRESESGNRIR